MEVQPAEAEGPVAVGLLPEPGDRLQAAVDQHLERRGVRTGAFIWSSGCRHSAVTERCRPKGLIYQAANCSGVMISRRPASYITQPVSSWSRLANSSVG